MSSTTTASMENLFDLSGKVALVTGGSRGIGEMIASGFVALGVRTYISSRKADVCDATAGRLSEAGECVSIPADLSSMAGINHLAGELSAREERLDILVNNAGAVWGEPMDDFPESGWDKVINVNLKSPFFLTQKLLPMLEKGASHEDPARVINIGSIDGLHVTDLPTFSYGASKAGLHHLTRILALHLAERHINVNAIAPGPFETKMMAHTLKTAGDKIIKRVPRKRIGQPADMAGAALFLSSMASSYVTGVVLPVDGGLTGTL
ncbi:MAG TPA: SDR family oxidoreductase [Woeseiaceae bacterium]|nr:SDR family oxidoreductase [Woeseiaceae bacterium]